MKQEEKLRLRNFFPYGGFLDYMKKCECNEVTYPRAARLLIYNGAVTMGLMVSAAKGLESILK